MDTQDITANGSQREKDRVIRGYGESGWTFGWDVFDLKDQFAYLGELVMWRDDIQRDRLADPDRALVSDRIAVTGDDIPGGDWTFSQQFVDELSARIERNSFELHYLSVKYGDGKPLTREQLKEAEFAWEQRRKA